MTLPPIYLRFCYPASLAPPFSRPLAHGRMKVASHVVGPPHIRAQARAHTRVHAHACAPVHPRAQARACHEGAQKNGGPKPAAALDSLDAYRLGGSTTPTVSPVARSRMTTSQPATSATSAMVASATPSRPGREIFDAHVGDLPSSALTERALLPLCAIRVPITLSTCMFITSHRLYQLRVTHA